MRIEPATEVAGYFHVVPTGRPLIFRTRCIFNSSLRTGPSLRSYYNLSECPALAKLERGTRNCCRFPPCAMKLHKGGAAPFKHSALSI